MSLEALLIYLGCSGLSMHHHDVLGGAALAAAVLHGTSATSGAHMHTSHAAEPMREGG